MKEGEHLPFQDLVRLFYRGRPGDKNTIITYGEGFDVQTADLPQAAADLIANDGVANLFGHGKTNAMIRPAVFSIAEDDASSR